MSNKRLIIENWYRLMNEEEESDMDSLLKDMKEENPEAYAAIQSDLEEFDMKDDPEAMAAMQAELAALDVDPHELSPENIHQMFNKFASEKEVGMMTDRGKNPMQWDQKKFNKEFDMTGDGQFDLQDVLELANKSIPYGIYFGSKWTGGFEDKDVSTKSATVKGLNVPALFKGMGKYQGQYSTAPYLIVYIIPAGGEQRFYIFNPQQAFQLDIHKADWNTESDDMVDQAILLSLNFTPAADLFDQYTQELEEEIAFLTKRQFIKSAISITIEDSAQDNLLGRMLQSGGVKSKYAYATDLNVKIGGSVDFHERVWQLLFTLSHLPMLTNVTFTLAGVGTGKQQKELTSLLAGGEGADLDKPFYSWKIDTAWLEEERLMEDYAMIKKIKKARNG